MFTKEPEEGQVTAACDTFAMLGASGCKAVQHVGLSCACVLYAHVLLYGAEESG